MKHLFIMAWALLLAACSGQQVRDGGLEPAQELQQQWQRKSIAAVEQQLQSMASLGEDPYVRYERGKLLYQLALLKQDWEANKQAQGIFESLLADDAFTRPAYRHAELRAYYGSLYTLKGRDMPGWWWVNNLTPVGLVRIHYVNKGVKELNHAVELDKWHPVVRLIRGNTFSNLPGFAGSKEEGLADMYLLLSWLQDKEANTVYGEIVQNREFRLAAFMGIAQVLEQGGDRQRASQAYHAVVALAPETAEANMAYAAIQRIDNSVREEM